MLEHIVNFIAAHWQAIGGFTLYSLIALIATMPVPGEPFRLYDWVYAWTHALINSPGAARFRPSIPNDPPKVGPK